jgi:hypothetical protein
LKWTRTHKDLEWFRPPERNILHSFLCIALGRAEVQSLRKLVSVSALHEEGLNVI